LSDVVFNRVFCLVSFRISFRDWFPICGCACRGILTRDATQPGPAWPALVHAPWHPCPSPHVPPPFSSFLSFNFPAHKSLSPISLSSPLCPRCSGDGYHRIWIPKVSSPPLSSLSPPLPPLPSPCALPSSPLRARAPGAPATRLPGAPRHGSLGPSPTRPSRSPTAWLPVPLARGPLAPSHVAPDPPAAWILPLAPAARLPRPLRGRPSPYTWPLGPLRAPVPASAHAAPGARSLPSTAWFPCVCPGAACVALTRSARPRAPPVRTTRSRMHNPTHAVIDFLVLINFKLFLVNALRRTLRRAANWFNFRFY
jgi:hypothetical protein